MISALNNIIKACFEGLFFIMLLGLIVYTIQSWRKNRTVALWMILVLLAMTIWRLFIPNFYSPRYAAILIFPAIIFSSFLIVKLKKWWYLLLIVFGIICCGKVFRPNPNGRLLIDAGKVICRDAADKNNPVIIVKRKDVSRMEFYSNIPALPFDESKNPAEILRDLPQIISNALRQSDTVYICCHLPRSVQFTAKELNLDGELKLIFSTLRSKRRKLYFNVYRYCRTSENSALEVPAGKNLIANGDFENYTVYSDVELQEIAKLNCTYFSAKQDKASSWILYSLYPDSLCEAESSLDGVINGKRSLRLKSQRHPIGICSNLFSIDKKAEFFSRVKGKTGALVEVVLLVYSGNRGESPRKITLLPVKIMKDDQLIETSFEFDPAEYGVSDKFFRLLLEVRDGEAYFDDVTVVNR